eukprot:Skav200496  [mRNA]  locus=scaffold450:291534:293522:+ [translate_table: standard]
MDPRTREPKTLEALTNAERRAIDLLLADKRSEQADYRHQVALEDDVLMCFDDFDAHSYSVYWLSLSLHEEAKKVKAAEMAEEVPPEVPAEGPPEVPPETAENVATSTPKEPWSIRLLPADERKLLEIRNRFSKKVETKVDDSKDTSASSNPFVKKRVATPLNGRAVPTAPVPKRQKVTVLKPTSTPPQVPEDPPPRKLKDLGPHKRGRQSLNCFRLVSV